MGHAADPANEMADPLGLIGNTPVQPTNPLVGMPPPPGAIQEGPGFKELLEQQIDRVNELENDAKEAAEDIATGRRTDIEGVILAAKKADIAFKMLLQVRNKMMDAYEEVKQVRV